MPIPMKDGEIIAPYDRVEDVNVITTVVHPQPIIGLGNLLILNKVTEKATLITPSAPGSSTGSTTGSASGSTSISGSTSGSAQSSQPAQSSTPAAANGTRAFSDTLNNDDRRAGILKRKVDTKTGALYRRYMNLDAVETDYPEGTPVYKKASAYFAQSYASDHIDVLDYVDGTLLDALRDFWTGFNWTFAIFSVNKLSDETILASNIFEANQDHFLVLQSDGTADFNDYYGQNWTIGLVHDTNEPMDAAFVGAIATRPIGQTTWKFKTLTGITPVDITSQERAGFDNSHVIAYINEAGGPETSEGFAMSGEYIDLLHGELWVNNAVGSSLEALLRKNIPYDHNGIGRIKSDVESDLLTAFEKGIIMEKGTTGKGDYTVVAGPREEQSRDNLSKRHYDGITFTYKAKNYVHTITIHGVIQSDTILS